MKWHIDRTLQSRILCTSIYYTQFLLKLLTISQIKKELSLLNAIQFMCNGSPIVLATYIFGGG